MKVRLLHPAQRQFVGEQRLLITTDSRDRHPGPLPTMPTRPIG
jgi:hypothetical protein